MATYLEVAYLHPSAICYVVDEACYLLAQLIIMIMRSISIF